MDCSEVLNLVFSRLNAKQLAMACCCCAFWREVGQGDDLWRVLCIERWPGCDTGGGSKIIEAMGGFRVFYSRRASAMNRPSKLVQPKPWLRLNQLTFFVDLTYKGLPIISEVLPGTLTGNAFNLSLQIDPAVNTDLVLPKHALTPSVYQGQVYFEKPFSQVHTSNYCLNWSVVRSTDYKVACLLHTSPAPDGILPWEDDGEDGGDDYCLPLLFQAELLPDSLKYVPLLAYACLDCRPVWGDSLSDPMHFELVELHLGVWKKDGKCPLPIDRVLLSLQELDWK